MNILSTHNHRLVICIDYDAPAKYKKNWNELKFKCENGDNKHIIEHIKLYCKIQANKNMPYLKRFEGGIGGNNNTIHKQLRFRNSFGVNIKDDDIILDQIIDTSHEKWTYDELDDLIYAFIKTANYYVKCDCVSGYIEMKNNNMNSDEYLDSDFDNNNSDII
jgi:hypothetical protein